MTLGRSFSGTNEPQDIIAPAGHPSARVPPSGRAPPAKGEPHEGANISEDALGTLDRRSPEKE